MKKLSFIQRSNQSHWVGDGFPVRSIFSYNELGKEMSPFLLLDYGGPTTFSPSTRRRGVGEHPHRGFETVTIAYAGDVEHRDSSGGGGVIRPGDVQWMTAASGIVHEEFHGPDFAKHGGPFEMIQLWVNLPAKDKKAAPGYQNIADAQIPRVELPGHAGFVRVIAGSYRDSKGPARTFSPINLWDVRLNADHRVEFPVPSGWGRRVSLKRLTMASLSASRKTRRAVTDFRIPAKTFGKAFNPAPSRMSTTSAAERTRGDSLVSSANFGMRPMGRLSTE